MKRQGVHALFSLDGVNPNHRRLAGKLNCRDNRVELGHIETSIELFPRFPFFDEQQGLSSVEVGIETGIQAAWRNPRRTEHGSEGAQQRGSLLIRGHDLHREYNQDSCLSVGVCKLEKQAHTSHRKKRANTKTALAR
jgi:hypothetical protein